MNDGIEHFALAETSRNVQYFRRMRRDPERKERSRAMLEHVALIDRRFYKIIKFGLQELLLLLFFLSFLLLFFLASRVVILSGAQLTVHPKF